jgi:hypothetical protein
VSGRRGAVALVAAIVALGAWLRVVHVGTPSLWWDELIEIRTAERPLADTLRLVRNGIGFGTGNAGAMPVDYVLLNAYLHATARPAPERLEAYFRAPACAASIAAIVALFVAGRLAFDATTGVLAALLLATSLPAILYAAEARSYSLLALMTALSTAAFAGVVRAPHRRGRWVLWVVTNALYFLTGVFALLVIGAQYGTLAVAWLRGRTARPGLVALVTSALVLAGVVVAYLARTNVGATYPRNAVVEPLGVAWASLRFFAADSDVLLAAFLVVVPFALAAGARRGTGAVAWALVLAIAALPTIGVVIRWKHYYFHGRHVIFLLPLFHLVVAAGVLELLCRLDPLRRLVVKRSVRRRLEALGAAVLALAIVGPRLRAFVAAPHAEFTLTKTLRDIGPLTRAVAARVATLEPGARYFLVAERDSTANAVLSVYLAWYGLTDRVTLRAANVPLNRVEPILRAHGGDPSALPLRPAHGLFFGFRILLGIEQPIGDVPARVSQLGIVGYTQPQTGRDVRRFVNVTLREPAAIAPSPPRS